MAGNNNQSKPDKDWAVAYQTWVNFAIHAQEQRWQPFAAYLVFNSLLILGWVTIFTVEDHQGWHLAAQLLICLTGIIVGAVWISLATDYTRSNYQAWRFAADAEEKFLKDTEMTGPITTRQSQVKGRGYRVILSISVTLIAAYIVFGALSYVAFADELQHNESKDFPYQQIERIVFVLLGAFLIRLAYLIINTVLTKEKLEKYKMITGIVASCILAALGIVAISMLFWAL